MHTLLLTGITFLVCPQPSASPLSSFFLNFVGLSSFPCLFHYLFGLFLTCSANSLFDTALSIVILMRFGALTKLGSHYFGAFFGNLPLAAFCQYVFHELFDPTIMKKFQIQFRLFTGGPDLNQKTLLLSTTKQLLIAKGLKPLGVKARSPHIYRPNSDLQTLDETVVEFRYRRVCRHGEVGVSALVVLTVD